MTEDGFRAYNLELLTRVVASCRDPRELENLLREVWTPGELRDAAQRVEVAAQLLEGSTYEMIAQVTGASTATISRVRRSVERGEGTLEIGLLRVGRGEGGRLRRRTFIAGGMLE
jgi:TrpR-related protein YerC/YecD